jgi:hypothetical protein
MKGSRDTVFADRRVSRDRRSEKQLSSRVLVLNQRNGERRVSASHDKSANWWLKTNYVDRELWFDRSRSQAPH